MIAVHPLLQRGIDEVVVFFGEDHVTTDHLEDGSVWLTVTDRDIGEGWVPRTVDVSTRLLPTFPTTPPYPFYLPSGLRRASGVAMQNLSDTEAAGRKVAQLSVNKPFGEADDLAARFVGVTEWLRRNA